MGTPAMGIFSKLANKSFPLPDRPHPSPSGRAIWREVFGREATNKEEGSFRPVPGGSYGRSVTSTSASFKRLVQAMRSMAPGGWSDDRWEETRHFVGITYVAVHRLCMQYSRSEFQVYQKDPRHPDGKRPITPNDPPQGDRLVRPWDLVNLLEKPNNQDSFGKWMYRLMQQKILTGTGLNWLVPNALGTPMEMYIIPTAIAIPQPAVNPDYPDGYYRIQPVYPYGPFSSYPTPASAVGAPIPAQWMVRFQYPHPLLRYDGYSPLTAMRQHIDQIESIDRSRWYQMKRTINPSAVLNFDEVEGMEPLPDAEIERIRTEFENTFMGSENTGQLFISAPGSRLEQWGNRVIDMDYPSGWDQVASFVLGGGFGITKQAAGMIEDASYSNLFATLKQLYMITLDPECDDCGSELTRGLAPYYGDNLIVEVRAKPINDQDINFQKIDKLIQARCGTKNMVMKLLDLPTTQEPWGDEVPGTEPGMGIPGVNGSMGGFGQSPGMAASAGILGAVTGVGADPSNIQPSDQQGEYETGKADYLRDEPIESVRGKPRPGSLGRGAGIPGKNYSSRLTKLNGTNGVKVKSMYDRVREVIANGHS